MRAATVIARALAAAALAGLAATSVAAAADRPGYPPARLWYRIDVKFKGESSFNSVLPAQNGVSEHEEGNATAQSWNLRSDHAVRLTLMCVDLSDFDPEPFLVRRTINGERRAVGGCPKNARQGLKPTARFLADLSGEVTSYSDNDFVGLHSRNGASCSGSELLRSLNGTQGLSAQVSTGSSLSQPLMLHLAPGEPFGNVHAYDTGTECVRPSGEVFTEPPSQSDRQFDPLEIMGGDPLEHVFRPAPDYQVHWTRVQDYLSFPVRAGNFGEDYVIQRTVSQPQLEAGSYPPPPSGARVNWTQKRYIYTIHLEACPRKGHDVEACGGLR